MYLKLLDKVIHGDIEMDKDKVVWLFLVLGSCKIIHVL